MRANLVLLFRRRLAALLSVTMWVLVCGVQPATSRAADFLQPEQAFPLTVSLAGPQQIALDFPIAAGYYLYRDRLAFAAKGATLGAAHMPAGHVKFDESLQKQVETYTGVLHISVPLSAVAPTGFELSVTSQGCAEAGLCYPPLTRRFKLTPATNGQPAAVQALADDGDGLPNAASALGSPAVQGSEASPTPPSEASATSEVRAGVSGDAGAVERVLRTGSWWSAMAAFWLMGLLLSFTPCVLPMLPILSSVIAGGGEVSRRRGFALSVAYALGMAMVYTGLGVAAGLAGQGLAAAMQNPWVLSLFALMLAGFSLAMFDVYELRLPHGLSNRLNGASMRLPGGRFLGVFLMGGISALVVSPCVSAPLAGALVFLSQTGNVAFAGSALFALAMGMSVPLLLLGASAGAWLPRSGAWMHAVKHFFGMLLLGVAWWIVQPILPAWLALAGWAGLLLMTGFMLRPFDAHPHSGAPRVWLQRAAGVAALSLGVMQLVGVVSGSTDALHPLGHLTGVRAEAASAALPFRPVRSVAELDAAVAGAHRVVMLDFWADWCVSCKELERETFSDPQIRQRLAGALLLRADVTANNPDDRALLHRFGLFGPPGVLFFDAQGLELTPLRVVGFREAPAFEKTLRAAGL